MVGLTRTAALEYIRQVVNAVNPGLIDTPVARDVVDGDERAYADIAKNVPIGRAGRPEEIASTVLWLCRPGASYVVGHALTVDGGMTVSCPELGSTGERGAAGGDHLPYMLTALIDRPARLVYLSSGLHEHSQSRTRRETSPAGRRRRSQRSLSARRGMSMNSI